MDSFTRSEVTRVKQVITCTSDRYRPSYGRYAQDHPRQCVFVGSTNKNDWNKDETGARRFWPIACNGEIDVAAIQANREQFFSEAVYQFKAGESWWEMPEEETRSEQNKRYDADVWIEPISEYVALKTKVSVNEILTRCLKVENSRSQRSDQMRVATCLRALGWKNVGNERSGHIVRKMWRRDES